jgi:glycine dehydrogenase subunit 1
MYSPHTKSEIEAMLNAIGKGKIEDLFQEIPEKYRFPFLDLPPALTEYEALLDLQEIASANATTKDMISFLGAGVYDHYIPAAVDSLLRRSEFYTSYTPYQPEISQGTLQAIFEYQSLICALTGMDVSNASHYDGATAAAEAVIMAYYRGQSIRNIAMSSEHICKVWKIFRFWVTIFQAKMMQKCNHFAVLLITIQPWSWFNIQTFSAGSLISNL